MRVGGAISTAPQRSGQSPVNVYAATILQNGPANGARHKRARTAPIDQSDSVLANLNSFHQRPDDFSLGREIDIVQTG